MLKLSDGIMPPVGVIRLIRRNKKTKKVLQVLDAKNVITYEGATILAHALTGDRDYRITHIYGEHADPGGSGYIPGSTNGLTALKSDTIDILRTPPRSTVNAESPVITASYYTSETPYQNNVVTFTASWSSDLLDGRIIVGAGMINQYRAAEYLFSHAYFPAQIKQPGEELICHWSEIFK